jgi:hypothetical protein
MQIIWPINAEEEERPVVGGWWYVTGQKRKRGEPLGSVWPWEVETEDGTNEGNDEGNEEWEAEAEGEGGEEADEEEGEEALEHCCKRRRLNWPAERDEEAAETEALDVISRLNPDLEKCHIVDS